MIKVLVEYNWKVDGKWQVPFVKLIEMPFVPTIGLTLFFENTSEYDLETATVQNIFWYEYSPKIVVAVANSDHTYTEKCKEYVLTAAASLGWVQKYGYELLDGI